MKEVALIVVTCIMTVSTYISYIPQMVKLLKTKKADDLSITSWLLWIISSIASLIYSVLLSEVGLIIASGSEFFLIFVVFILTVYYNYCNNYYIESEENFKKRINTLCQRDGNHMILITAIIKDREVRIANRKSISVKVRKLFHGH